jgi:cytochrome c peroxidase
MAITHDASDRGRFKTPTLRGLALTAPYMHDGSKATLEEVVTYYRDGGIKNSYLAPVLAPIEMSDDDARNLVQFLRALSRPAAAR